MNGADVIDVFITRLACSVWFIEAACLSGLSLAWLFSADCRSGTDGLDSESEGKQAKASSPFHAPCSELPLEGPHLLDLVWIFQLQIS